MVAERDVVVCHDSRGSKNRGIAVEAEAMLVVCYMDLTVER